MIKSKKRVICRILIAICLIIVVVLVGFIAYFFNLTSGLKIDDTKFVSAISEPSLTLLSVDGTKIDLTELNGEKYISIEELPQYVVDGFIATEDKRFYTHSGIDFKRMVGATINNIKNGGFREGASTISQQLIKNTHLSNEKTFERKFKEIKLARELERKYSKKKILELYLNTIYFGNGCYGIEKASNLYFNKSASRLTLGESALLVGVIKAPTFYDPIDKKENCEKRKNTVLKLMLDQGYISNDEYEKNAKNQEKVVNNAQKQPNIYINSIINELCDILNVSENQVKNMNLIVQTSIDLDVQNNINNIIKNNQYNVKNSQNKYPSQAVLVLDNQTKSIVAIGSNLKNILSLKRQPGSTIKPIIAYAPSLEVGKITTESFIVDEPININGYSPQNASKMYNGKVSIREAISKSLNIPAVKTLSNLGVENGKKFASNLGLEFDEKDTNLALALGGMSQGVTIKQLADAYSSFATHGDFAPSSFVNNIKDKNGHVVYKRNVNAYNAMKDSTAYLITDMLRDVSIKGTASRLNSLDLDIASKTGTVGVSGSTDNKDAWCVAYTKDYLVVSWLGAINKDEQMSRVVNGSSYPAELTKNVFTNLKNKYKFEKFNKPDSVGIYEIDNRFLDQNKLVLANETLQERYKKEVLFSNDNLPVFDEIYESHKVELEVELLKGEKPKLKFETKRDNIYKIYRRELKSDKLEVINEIKSDGENVEFIDLNAITNEIYEYYVESYHERNQKDIKTSNAIKLLSY